MKNKLVLFLVGCCVLALSSCLGNDEVETQTIKDPQVKAFSLKNDSVSGLNSVKFSIDQLNDRIYNIDSMPYGTKIEKVVCTFTPSSGFYALQVYQEATGDTIMWNGSDSLNFSKPVVFITTAYDGVTKKTYHAQVNIHQCVPDSLEWGLYTNQMLPKATLNQQVLMSSDSTTYYMYAQTASGFELYKSPATDTPVWTLATLTGFPADALLKQAAFFNNEVYVPSAAGVLYHSANGSDFVPVTGSPVIAALYGAINKDSNSDPVLSLLVKDGNAYRFASMSQSGTFSLGEVAPDQFPVEGFSSHSYTSMYYERLMVVAGKTKANQLTNAAWSTFDGKSWALLTDESSSYFEKKEGAALAYYDDKFYLIGGLNASGNGSKEIHLSIDKGVSWALADSMVMLPSAFAGRGYSSVVVEKNKYMLIFGGKTSNNAASLNEIWRGRINRLGFKE
ncbi:MAG: DUF5018 domain-containing protein [Porphyromonadaceae bacterium]|nr:DUF5018 domain-containing protein [Porphyromonadaceae bacterium]